MKTLRIQAFKSLIALLVGIVVGAVATWALMNQPRESDSPYLHQGILNSTNRSLDVALSGDGFFRVSMAGKTAYTRVGSFVLNRNSELALQANGERPVTPAVRIPRNAVDLDIRENGEIWCLLPGATQKTLAGRLEVVRFANVKALKSLGGAYFAESAASGAPITCIPGQNGAAVTIATFIEEWNTDRAREELAQRGALAMAN